VDISAGMVSGQRILTLQNADVDLQPFAVPATSDASGAAKYGTDGYWFNTADPGSAPNNIRSALRGGSWITGTLAGVFALNLINAPSDTHYFRSLRCSKSI